MEQPIVRYEEALEAFKEATSHYEGTLKLISDTEAEFTAMNEFERHFNVSLHEGGKTEWKNVRRKIPTRVSIEEGLAYDGKKFIGVNVEEKTCEFMGGRAFPCRTLENVKESLESFLKDFNFVERKGGYEQLSLF